MTRKDAGLHVADRIQLTVSLPLELADTIRSYQQYICHETLAEELSFANPSNGMYVSEQKLQGKSVAIAVSRINSADNFHQS
jgi:hypothetical protein